MPFFCLFCFVFTLLSGYTAGQTLIEDIRINQEISERTIFVGSHVTTDFYTSPSLLNFTSRQYRKELNNAILFFSAQWGVDFSNSSPSSSNELIQVS